MGDVSKVFASHELQGLDEEKKQKLQQALDEQLNAEARAIIQAYHDLKAQLKEGLGDTLDQLKSE